MNNDFKKNFGKKVKYYRNLIGYTQEELAEKVGVSTNTIGYIERGKNIISSTKLPILSEALKIKTYQLFIDINIDENTNKIEKINELLKTANNKQIGIILNLIKDVIDI